MPARSRRSYEGQEDIFGDWLTTDAGVEPPAVVEPDRQPLTAVVEPDRPPLTVKSINDARYDLAKSLVPYLTNDTKITSKILNTEADRAFGGSQAAGTYSSKDAYDAVETAFNIYLLGTENSNWGDMDAAAATEKAAYLTKKIQILPTQTRRDAEMDEFQQFSTPPALAFVVNWVANISKGDLVAEPSAGTGDLAVWSQISGAEIVLNELSPRRHALLKATFPSAQLFQENAEQLNNVLPPDLRPDVVLMNPPFSATAGRVQGQRKTANAARHIEQALLRLKDGGRLVAVVGNGMAHGRPAFHHWWKTIEKKYNVRADIGISGDEYRKYGTTFDNQILVIDKTGPTVQPNVLNAVYSVSELPKLLEGVKHELSRTTNAVPRTKPTLVESTGVEATEREPDIIPPRQRTGGSVTDSRGTARRDGDDQSSKRTRTTDLQDAVVPGLGNVPDDRIGAGGRVSAESDTRDGIGGGGDIGGDHRVPSRPDRRPVRISVEKKHEEAARGGGAELDDEVFSKGSNRKVVIEGAQAHQALLVESAAMSEVDLPDPYYRPLLYESIVSEGLLSEDQLEAVVYAGQAHEQHLPNGSRTGFFIGDGTGVGKGREISGTILDNWLQGRTKAVWVSASQGLMEDARRDYAALGEDPLLIFNHGKIKAGDQITQKEGILFTTYATMRSAQKKQANDLGQVAGKTRLEQIQDWLGDDFDGVIAFDESHKMGNATATGGVRGTKKPSAQAICGLELQRSLPDARILYVSATGATELSNLSYADRLGLWGEGTPFIDNTTFITEVGKGGIAAMELVSRDMKSLGMYISRSLSFVGVDYERLDHNLTTDQEEVYNALAGAWQTVLQNIDEALKVTQAAKSPQASSVAKSQFWGAHQRFFNQIITAMQTPTVIDDMRRQLDAGNVAVIQLVNTNEASQERIIANATANKTVLEELDFTPRELLIDYVKGGFPVVAYAEVMDSDGKVSSEAVKDSEGNPVFDQEAIRMRDALLKDLEHIRVTENPLDMIINTFGPDQVAEVTGRKRRFVRIDKDDGGYTVEEQKRSRGASMSDAAAFQAGKRNILIFSEAGGTGFSFHADKTTENLRKRVHWILQPGWKADVAVQGFGRTHRTNQSEPPLYVLPTTNLKAQKRFISSIARRLDQLGALTRGQRETTSQGVFTAADNLESEHAASALRNFFSDLYHGKTPLDFADVTKEMGLKLIDEKTGGFKQNSIPEMPQFLNRLLSLSTDTQNAVFDEFEERLVEAVDYAKQQGIYDTGMTTMRAKNVIKTRDDVIHNDKRTLSKTRYVELAVTTDIRYWSWEEASKFKGKGPLSGWYVFDTEKKKGEVFYMSDLGTRPLDENHQIIHRGAIHSIRKGTPTYVNYADKIAEGSYNKRDGRGWKRIELSRSITVEQAEQLWRKQVKDAPETETKPERLIVGVILPLWDRLEGKPKIFRWRTDDGEQLLGCRLTKNDAVKTLINLSVEPNVKKTTKEIFAAINEGQTAKLANGWQIGVSRVNFDKRIEIKQRSSFTVAEVKLLETQGVFDEGINWQKRYFIPNNEAGELIFDRITETKPVVEMLLKKTDSMQVDEDVDEDAELAFGLPDEPPSIKKAEQIDLNGKLEIGVLSHGMPDASQPKLNGAKRPEGTLMATSMQNTKPKKSRSKEKDKRQYHEIVAEKLIKQLKEGTAPWQIPWGEGGSMLPHNPITGARYHGINALNLMGEGYSDNRWMTYKQAVSVNTQVRKGEKGTAIQYWKFDEMQVTKDDEGNPVLDKDGETVKERVKLKFPRVFFSTVFNGDQIDGLKPLEKKQQTWDPNERVERLLTNSGANIKHDRAGGACYSPSEDTIHLPKKAMFVGEAQYYATATHELGHWTGHANRLDRDILHPHGSIGYAKEELRAEIFSMIIGDELGIGHDPGQHAAYVASWIKVLEDDPREIMKAAGDAEKIQEYVMAFDLEHQLEQPAQTQGAETETVGKAQGDDKAERTRIYVPFAEKEEAKKLGAKWDKVQKSWGVPGGIDIGPFNKWVKPSAKKEKETIGKAQGDDKAERTRIYVPFAEKEEAKKLDAKWDKDKKSWGVPGGIDIGPFDKWMQRPEKLGRLLYVPYLEKDEAEKLGAKWDGVIKDWYAPDGVDIRKLERWHPENFPVKQEIAKTPREELTEAMLAMGLIVSDTHPIMDGQIHMVMADGDKDGELSGSYGVSQDQWPEGQLKNDRTGADMEWKALCGLPTDQERAALAVKCAEKIAEQEAEEIAIGEQVAAGLARKVEKLSEVSTPTPYMTDKKIKAHPGLLTDDGGVNTYIPATDTARKVWGMEHIHEDGTSTFKNKNWSEGCFHVVGGMEALCKANVLVIAEGYATAATIAETLNFATVAAFNCDNLKPVAEALHDKYPNKPIVIVGDNDRYQTFTHGTNDGKTKAEEAAKAVGAEIVLPIFWINENSSDLEILISPERCRKGEEKLSEEERNELGRMKKHTNFNDMAVRSKFGRQGVENQVKAVVGPVVEIALRKQEIEKKNQKEQAQKKEWALSREKEARARDRDDGHGH